LGLGALCGNGGGQGVAKLAVCQPCSLPINTSRIVTANGMSAPATLGNEDGAKKEALVITLGLVGTGVAVFAVAGAAFYLVAIRKWERKKMLRLGESSSRWLCRKRGGDGDADTTGVAIAADTAARVRGVHAPGPITPHWRLIRGEEDWEQKLQVCMPCKAP
jgi:hypothetical protein